MSIIRRAVALLAVVGLCTAHAVEVDPALPSYTPTTGVSGTIKSVGSDTMNNMMTLWAEGFLSIYPNVGVEIEGKGSSTAPPALIAGTSSFGPMSRQMKGKESDAFEAKFGYKPVQLPTSIDMLAVFVNKDNPIAKQGLTIQQIDSIFSSTFKKGGQDITAWGQLGLGGEFANQPVSIYGRNSASGTYGYFKKNAMGKGDFKASVKEQPGSSSVVQGVATDKFAIGYSGIGYKTADVHAIPLDGVAPSENTVDDYPLARFLWLSVNVKPGTQLDPLRAEFIKYIFSKEGQTAVIRDGYLPVSAAVAAEALAAVGL